MYHIFIFFLCFVVKVIKLNIFYWGGGGGGLVQNCNCLNALMFLTLKNNISCISCEFAIW